MGQKVASIPPHTLTLNYLHSHSSGILLPRVLNASRELHSYRLKVYETLDLLYIIEAVLMQKLKNVAVHNPLKMVSPQ